jgi:hypothetical protein
VWMYTAPGLTSEVAEVQTLNGFKDTGCDMLISPSGMKRGPVQSVLDRFPSGG